MTHKNYLPYLDSARALAVMLVFGVHFISLYLPQWSTSQTGHFALLLGHQGVNLFFVLSGYLLYQAFLQRPTQPAWPYFKKRAARIFPAYWATLSIYIVLILAGLTDKDLDQQGWSTWLLVFTNILLLSPFLSAEPLVSVSWTLTYEWVWYLLLPCVFVLHFHKLTAARRYTLLILALFFAALYWGSKGGPETFSLFFWGALLAEWRATKNAPGSKRCKTAMLVGWPLLIMAAVFAHDISLPVSILLSGAGWTVLLFSAMEKHATPGKLYQSAIWLGRWSYSFYLLHSLALHATNRFLPNDIPIACHFVAALSLSLFLAYAGYRWVEKPALSLLSSRIKPQRTSGVTV